jgi:hypothetical protein
MIKRTASIAAVGVVAVLSTVALTRSPEGVTVHEWGTFTTVAGTDGRAIEWLPLGGPTDLPCFVHHFTPAPDAPVRLNVIKGEVVVRSASGSPATPARLTYETARTRLFGKVRMETPVIYFYTPTDVTVNINVGFKRGIISEFYPYGVTTQAVTGTSLTDPNQYGFIAWRDVRIGASVSPSYPHGGGESHYYAARATDASPLQVGQEREKFIFYRGVAGFDVPIQTAQLSSGAMEVRNIGNDGPLPNVVLFENRGGRIGYRINGKLVRADTIAAPSLDGSLAELKGELQSMLVKAGLYPKEAAAMIDTWRDSWFEAGTRVFYIMPRKGADAILPLAVTPAPAATERVFVGRMDVLTESTLKTVEQAIVANDNATVAAYSRFLGPIADRLVARSGDQTRNAYIRQVAGSVFAGYVKRAQACEKPQ